MRARCIRSAWVGLACLAVLSLAACGKASESEVKPPLQAELSHEAFLARHWARPMERQTDAAATPDRQGASLDPASCGACHMAQHEDWRGSLHSRAMGPGVAGQLVTMVAADPASAESCLRCHAPLAEQAESLAASVRAGAPNDSRLHEHGLTCAGCHMRAGSVYGPPRRDGSVPGTAASEWPHKGWIGAPAFEQSGFCAACHQFEEDGFALNGKLLENTFEEWKTSVHASEGRSCQSCHMPERRHLWRGIHDPDMVRRALTIDVSGSVVLGSGLKGEMRIRNTGAGHYFPTYVTPKVIVEAYQEDGAGRMLPGTRHQQEISRNVTLDLSKEIADTRIPPGGQMVFSYRMPHAAGAVALIFRLRVEPDAFYRSLYESLLAAGETGQGEAQIRRALQDATDSAFIAYTTRLPLVGQDNTARKTGRPAKP